ncbi:MAG: thioredoxin [Eubacteriaceae bacterium]|nr:thioredoxin [Eubacteriaceae bacterium]
MKPLANSSRKAIQAVLLATGILFAGIGVMRGEAGIILRKAVYICLECIGIG